MPPWSACCRETGLTIRGAAREATGRKGRLSAVAGGALVIAGPALSCGPGVGNRQLAEDLVAESFAKAWTSWRKIRGLAEPRAWIIRTALNAHVSWWRRHRHEVALGSHDATAAASQDMALDASLLAALRRLPVRQRHDDRVFTVIQERLAGACEALGEAHPSIPASGGHQRQRHGHGHRASAHPRRAASAGTARSGSAFDRHHQKLPAKDPELAHRRGSDGVR
jgi:Sigma-70 region 2